ncbi:hypothetical protein AB0H73_39325 [Streptomyces olivoreticuli]
MVMFMALVIETFMVLGISVVLVVLRGPWATVTWTVPGRPKLCEGCCQVAYGVGELGCAEVWVWRWWHLGQLAAGVPVTVFQTRKRSVISVR